METVNKDRRRRTLALVVGLTASFLATSAQATASDETLVSSKCGACHREKAKGQWDRISDSRRTPEGWDMTVARMSFAHGVKLTADERGAIVKYLADAYGLAPEETAAHRYILDRTPSVVEHPENKLIGDTCARCHSYGRIAVQRRTEADWRKLVNFHVGQFPGIEIQSGGRDRDWFEIATGEVSAELGKKYGVESASWTKWKDRTPMDASGVWRLVGYQPGVGSSEGTATITRISDDRYSVDMTLRYENGSLETSKGAAVIYTGHEWRASVKQGSRQVHHVMSFGAGGDELSGRWFEENNDSIGGSLRAVRADKNAVPQVLSVQPSMVRAGTREKLAINGVALGGEVDLGSGVKVVKVVGRSAKQIVVEVEVAKDATSGAREVKVGAARGADVLRLYRQIDYVKIMPEHPLARIGDGGGRIPKVPAQLEAIAWAAGEDGKPGTADDIRLGAVPAVWSVDNLNKVAAAMQDKKYAGQIEQDGLFVPNVAGPNPERKYKADNAGELKVTAKVKDGSRRLEASVPLIVTVQRFNDPPIR